MLQGLYYIPSLKVLPIQQFNQLSHCRFTTCWRPRCQNFIGGVIFRLKMAYSFSWESNFLSKNPEVIKFLISLDIQLLTNLFINLHRQVTHFSWQCMTHLYRSGHCHCIQYITTTRILVWLLNTWLDILPKKPSIYPVSFSNNSFCNEKREVRRINTVFSGR